MKPNTSVTMPISLKPVMQIKSIISCLKLVPPNYSISYGRTYQTTNKTVIATITIGYADGIPRQLSNHGYISVNNQKAPIIGRVCMDQLMVNVTGIDNVREGQEVSIIGFEDTLSFDDIADKCDTIGYEIVCHISNRVPRIAVETKRCNKCRLP